ncbi:hypothetical protein O0L34_g792 [Tuta absoluta]|nr:hypothetical protein O0L34_g792 [Tuta absoluta]
MWLCRTVQRNGIFLAHLKPCLVHSVAVRKLSSSPSQDEKIQGKYDVIIAGGGMVGCTLACAFGKNPILSTLKVLLLEGSPSHSYELKPEYSNRVVALNQNTKALMKSLNVWQHVENARVQPVRHMQVWDACSDALISFTSSDILDDDIAYIVENDLLLDSVSKQISQTKNVDIVYGAKIAGYDLAKKQDDLQTQTKNLVKMANGDTYACELLVSSTLHFIM